MHLSESDWAYVDERAEHFTGRGWVFERVRSFLASDARLLVIVAPPGTGKTAIAARLAQASAGHPPDGAAPVIKPNTIAAAVFCQAGQVSLLQVAQDLADQLSELEDFAAELRRTVAPQVTVSDVMVPVAGSVSGSVTGVRIDLAPLGAERAFADGLALPLRRLGEKPAFQPPVLLVDSLDEAYASPVAQTLPRSLADLRGVRLIVTTRDDPRVLAELGGLDGLVAAGRATVVNLIDDAPPDIDDIGSYAAGRLRGRGPNEAVAVLAGRIGQAAEGNFLYAYHVVGGLLGPDAPAVLDVAGAAALALPPGGLAGVYRDFLGRELGVDDERWQTLIRPILAPLAVALGDGLDTTQLAAIGSVLAGRAVLRSTARDVTRRAGQFLEGPRPDGPFQVYHRSFADFLLDPQENPDWPVDPAETHGAIVAGLLPRDATATADQLGKPSEFDDWRAVDSYALQHLAAHLGAFDPQGLVMLLANYGYVEAKLLTFGYGALIDDFEYAAPIPAGSSAERTLKSLRGVMRLAGQAIMRDPAELPAQLIGRLAGSPDEAVRQLVVAARGPGFASWLEPLGPSLAAPGGVFRVPLRGHEGTPRSVAISADGRAGASAGNSRGDQTVRVWDLDDIKEPLVLRDEAAGGGYTPMALSGDGLILMTAYGNEVRLWDRATGRLAARFPQHQSPVQAVAIADVSSVAATGDGDGIVLLWDLRRRTLTRQLRSGPDEIQALALTPDGRRLAVLAGTTIELWDVAGTPVRRRSTEHRFGNGFYVPIAIAHDASSIAYGNRARTWDVGTDEVRWIVEDSAGRALAITIDGRRILTAGRDDQGCDVWDFAGRRLWALPDREARASSGALSRDGRWAITAYSDHRVVAWDLDAPLPSAGMVSATQPISRVVIGPDGCHAAAFAQSAASVWDLDSGQAVTGPVADQALEAIETRLAIDEAIVERLEAARVATDAEAGDHRESDRPAPSEAGLGIFVHRDFYRHHWAIGAAGRLALHWLEPKAKTSEAEEDPGSVAGSDGYRVNVVDVEAAAPVVRLAGHAAHLLGGAISEDGRRAATGSIGRLVRVWDLPGGDLRATLPAHRDPVSAVDLSADGRLLVSASWDGSVRVWDAEVGRAVATFSGDSPMLTCAISADGSRVVAGDRAGRVHILRLHGTTD